MSARFSGLWRHPDFMKLWVGETVSVFGSQITMLALPLTAVLVLNATPSQMGFLTAIEFAPFLILSLFAGVWVDRLPRRPILMISNIGRTLLLGSIPLASMLEVLTIEYLYVVGLFVGIMTVFFDVAYQAYLPALVDRDQLVEGNAKLEVSRSVSYVAGPGLAGLLVQLITAPFAIALDALSFLFSSICIGLIRKPEPAKTVSQQQQKKNVWAEIGEGLGVVFGNPLLRSIAGCTGTSNLFGNIGQAVFTIFVVRELGIGPALLGIIFAVGSVGGMIGAVLAGWVAKRFGVGPTIVVSAFSFGIAACFTPFATKPLEFAIPILIIGQFIMTVGGPIYNITQVSLRQAITPHRLQGRMNASMRFLVWGTMPIGSIIGGFLGESIGLRPTLIVAAVGSFISFLFVAFSPVRHLTEQPAPVNEENEPAPAAM